MKIPAINKQTAVVVSKSNEVVTEFRSTHNISSLSPLPIISAPKNNNLTGIKFGRFIVIGLYPNQPNIKKISQKGLRWVVKCSCGRYETRFSKVIKNYYKNMESGVPDYGLCQQCRMTNVLMDTARIIENHRNENFT